MIKKENGVAFTKKQAKEIIKNWHKIMEIKSTINSTVEICNADPTLHFWYYEDFVNFCKALGIEYKEDCENHFITFYENIRIVAIKD